MSAQSMGFMYIGTAPCGCFTGMSWDDADAKKSNALFVAKMIRRGDSVARVERFEGDDLPMHECEQHAAERAARKAAKATGPALFDDDNAALMNERDAKAMGGEK